MYIIGEFGLKKGLSELSEETAFIDLSYPKHLIGTEDNLYVIFGAIEFIRI